MEIEKAHDKERGVLDVEQWDAAGINAPGERLPHRPGLVGELGTQLDALSATINELEQSLGTVLAPHGPEISPIVAEESDTELGRIMDGFIFQRERLQSIHRRVRL